LLVSSRPSTSTAADPLHQAKLHHSC